jgi:hypothetical protein
MSKIESKFVEADIQQTYSDAALAKARSNYAFMYKIDGFAHSVRYDPQKEVLLSYDKHDKLFDLAQEIELLIRDSKADFDIFEVRRFLCKHLQAMIKVGQELQRAPVSERCFEVLDSKPVDMETLSLEEQCFYELVQEQLESTEQGAAVDGLRDDVTYTVTPEMIEAKMKEKMQKQN